VSPGRQRKERETEKENRAAGSKEQVGEKRERDRG
jgi:hypothetical protein